MNALGSAECRSAKDEVDGDDKEDGEKPSFFFLPSPAWVPAGGFLRVAKEKEDEGEDEEEEACLEACESIPE